VQPQPTPLLSVSEAPVPATTLTTTPAAEEEVPEYVPPVHLRKHYRN
jgi:hypothetical protein